MWQHCKAGGFRCAVCAVQLNFEEICYMYIVRREHCQVVYTPPKQQSDWPGRPGQNAKIML